MRPTHTDSKTGLRWAQIKVTFQVTGDMLILAAQDVIDSGLLATRGNIEAHVRRVLWSRGMDGYVAHHGDPFSAAPGTARYLKSFEQGRAEARRLFPEFFAEVDA